VTVHRFDQLRRTRKRAELEVECSSGTYVRSLVAELGDAYCESLRRTAIGPFSVDEAEAYMPLSDALARLPDGVA
jgi:tRNA pseudouridine55 synthase